MNISWNWFANPSKRHQNLSTYIQAKGCSTCDTNCGTMIPSTLSLRFREFYFEYCAGRWADTVATMLPSCKTGTSNRKTKPNQATEWKRNGVHPVAPVKSKLLWTGTLHFSALHYGRLVDFARQLGSCGEGVVAVPVNLNSALAWTKSVNAYKKQNWKKTLKLCLTTLLFDAVQTTFNKYTGWSSTS